MITLSRLSPFFVVCRQRGPKSLLNCLNCLLTWSILAYSHPHVCHNSSQCVCHIIELKLHNGHDYVTCENVMVLRKGGGGEEMISVWKGRTCSSENWNLILEWDRFGLGSSFISVTSKNMTLQQIVKYGFQLNFFITLLWNEPCRQDMFVCFLSLGIWSPVNNCH